MSNTIRSQLTFKGIRDCKEFKPNAFKKIRCMNCSHDLDEHTSEAVSDEYIALGIEALQKDVPASLIHTKDQRGKLFLGGYIASTEKFVNEQKIKRIVNCAGGLDKFFVGWGKQVEKMEKNNKELKFLRLGWSDHSQQVIYEKEKYDTLEQCILFIEEGLSNGENVVVHCAQGKSRSGTVAVAYIMASLDMGVKDSLEYIKKNRPMVEPNEGFMSQLLDFHKSDHFKEIQKKILK